MLLIETVSDVWLQPSGRGGRGIMLQAIQSTEGCYDVREAKEFGKDYSWVEDCLEWLEGKEARREYYNRLEKVASC